MNDPTRLRDVFDQAASMPPADREAFLARACGDNAALRREVERLLAADARGGSVFDSQPGETSDGSGPPASATQSPTLTAGTRFGPYVIVAPLGAGGMGEVYEARDTRLGRTVALKVLPPNLSGDPLARQRFEREARAVAALSHPHICPLFDVGCEGDRDYLVMEYLAGETLAARLRRGKLRLADALGVAGQIAGALVAAHRAGIVHRDLKPGNVMLTESGVRLLDFGLARHTDATPRDAPTVSLPEPLTGTGMILGTLPYMAPEQIEGRAADARTDIFAFGVVLYEMVTGRRAFEASSQAALVGSILRDDPPSLATVDPTLPSALDRLIRRCMAKDPQARWHSVEDMRAVLVVSQGVRRRRLPLVVGGLFVSAVLAGALGVALWPTAHAVPRVTAIRRVTHDRTLKETPYTDGTRVFYTSWSTGLAGTSLFQVPVAGGESAPLPTPFRSPLILHIFPNGKELLVVDRDRSQLHAMPIFGGQPRPIGEIHADFAGLSRDGRRIVFSGGNDLFSAASDGSGVHRLLASPVGVMLPRWAPDARRVRYTAVTASEHTIWEVAADGTGAHALLPGWAAACCGDWTADGTYFVFEAERDGEYALWALAEPGGWPWRRRTGAAPVKLTTGPMRYENAVPSPDGKTILALGTPPSTGELVRFDQRLKQFVPMLSGLSASYLDFSRDGQWVTYVNHADATLWRSRSDGSDRRQLTFPPASVSAPRWSPDAAWIAYPAKAPGGPSRIFIVAAEGGQPRQITAEGRAENDVTWSADGGHLVFAGEPDRTTDSPTQIQIVDIRSRRVSTIPGSEHLFSPRWSPDGRSIAALSEGGFRLVLYEFSTGRWRDVTTDGVGWPNWTRDSTQIQVQHGPMVVRVRVADGQMTPVASLEGIRLVSMEGGSSWVGLAPDFAPLVLREVTPAPEIYALEVEWP